MPSKKATSGPRPRTSTPTQTKTEKALALLRRSKGATVAELGKATGWQEHSIRGFMSGTLKKRKGHEVVSAKDDKGARRYRIADKAGQ